MDIELALLKTDLFNQEAEVVYAILESHKDLKKDKEYDASFNESKRSLLGEILKTHSEYPKISQAWRKESASFNQEVLWNALRSGLKATRYQINCCNEDAEDEMLAWLEVNKSVWGDTPERRAFVFETAMEDGLLKIMNLCTDNGLDLSDGNVVLSTKDWGAKSILGRADAKTIPSLIKSGLSPFVGDPRPWDEWFSPRHYKGLPKISELGCSMVYKDLLKESNQQAKDVWLLLATRTTVSEINNFLKNAGKVGLWDLKDEQGKTTGMVLAEKGQLFKGVVSSIPVEEWSKRDNRGHTMAYYMTKHYIEQNESIGLMAKTPFKEVIVPMGAKDWAELTKEEMNTVQNWEEEVRPYATPSSELLKIPYKFNSVLEDNSELTEYLGKVVENEYDLDRLAIAVLSAPTNYRNKSNFFVATPNELNEWQEALRNAFPKDNPLWQEEKIKDLGILMLWKAHSQESFDLCSGGVTNKVLQDWLNMGGSFSRAFDWAQSLVDKETEKANEVKASLSSEQLNDFRLLNAIAHAEDKLESRWIQDVMGDKYLGDSEEKMRRMFKEFQNIEENHQLKLRAMNGIKSNLNKSLSAL